MARLGLGDLIGAGPRAVSRYTGTLLAVFVAQSIIVATCMVAVALVVARAFSHLPMFDEAVDGDLVALIYFVRYGKPSLVATGGIVFGAIVLWQLARNVSTRLRQGVNEFYIATPVAAAGAEGMAGIEHEARSAWGGGTTPPAAFASVAVSAPAVESATTSVTTGFDLHDRGREGDSRGAVREPERVGRVRGVQSGLRSDTRRHRS